MNELILPFEKPLFELKKRIESVRKLYEEQNIDVTEEIRIMEKTLESTKKEIYSKLTSWQRIQLARHPQRPYAQDYIKIIFSDFQELHGDRSFGDDQALTGGIGFFDDQAVMVISQQKGHNTKENIERNFGMPSPEGYRKALRLMKLAEKFNLPVITFIDTPGAYPGIESEERHVAEAIAVNLREMSVLSVPIIAIILGEGGSGGALGIGVANRVLCLENAYYSVISPEGCAAILWKNRDQAEKASEALKLGSNYLVEQGIADEIINEPFGGAHNDSEKTIDNARIAIKKQLKQLSSLSMEEIQNDRYMKFRNMGIFEEKLKDSNQAISNEDK